tara:strand:+ start:788 stop:976 length:189 start_codon:yes stop_codon:yes gene_type:complete
MDELPITVEELLEKLSEVYPSEPASLKDSDREVWFKAGQRSVVDFLLLLKARGDENILNKRS